MGAVELGDDRYEDYAVLWALTLFGDYFFQCWCRLESRKMVWRNLDLTAISGTLTIDGVEHASGFSSYSLGDPLEVLV